MQLVSSSSSSSDGLELMKRDDEAEHCNMTELRYDAPLATFDGDEWSEFLDDEDDDKDDDVGGRDCASPVVQYADSLPTVAVERRHRGWDEPDCGVGSSPRTGGDGFGDDAFSGSLEDLVSCFDENVRRCFRNYSEDTEFIAPVQIRTHEQVLHESQSVFVIVALFSRHSFKNYRPRIGPVAFYRVEVGGKEAMTVLNLGIFVGVYIALSVFK